MTLKEIIEKDQINPSLPKLLVGDHIIIYTKIIEGKKTRVQPFQGDIIAKMGGKGSNAKIIVRKRSFGVPVEKTFPINSPLVKEIKILWHGKVRRSKLYYIRERIGKFEKIKKILH